MPRAHVILKSDYYTRVCQLYERGIHPTDVNLSSIVGPSNECEVILNNQVCTALLDTGSTVSTVTKSLCKQYLSGFPEKIHALDEILKVEAAGGHKLPYSGFVETELKVTGMMTSKQCILLVVADTSYGNSAPVIIGTNVLSSMMQTLKDKYGVQYMQRVTMPTSLDLNIQNRKIKRSDGKLCVIKSAETKTIIL